MSYKPSPELKTLIEKLLGNDAPRFFEGVGEQLPHAIRFNTVKGDLRWLKKILQEQGFEPVRIPGFDDMYRLAHQPYPIGKSLSHFLGHIYVQDMASMLPARVLAPQPGEAVLDMAAAPGSKTTQMAVMMQNTGVIIANDIVLTRLRALINNLQRFGILNTAVVKQFGESLGNRYFETFDRVLLDPACSGLGTLHKTPEVLTWWTPEHCQRLAANQRHQIASAIKALKPGGILVYSTCTLTPDENEEVINYALTQFPVELEPVDLPKLVTRPGLIGFEGKTYHAQMEWARRLYPFENEAEGFFVARLRKTATMEQGTPRKEYRTVSTGFIPDSKSPVKKYLDYLALHFSVERDYFKGFRYSIDKTISAVSPQLADFSFKLKPLKTGLLIGRPMKQAAKFTTEGVHLFGAQASKNVINLTDAGELEKYVNRQNLVLQDKYNAQVIVKYRGIPIGYGLSDKIWLKSQFPKSQWPFKLRRD